jgi:hypothetical protein
MSGWRSSAAHFSEDILSALLNEPIPGQGVFWSSAGGKPYPVSIRALSFEKMFQVQDPGYIKAAVDTFANQLRAQFQTVIDDAVTTKDGTVPLNGKEADAEPIDVLAGIENKLIEQLRHEMVLMGKIKGEGVAWGAIKAFFVDKLPPALDDRDNFAYNLVPKALDRIFGPQKVGWQSFKHTNGKTYVKGLKS